MVPGHLGRRLSDEDVERLAKEDPKIRRHLDVIRRKELLELVLDKMESLRQIEGGTGSGSGSSRERSIAGKEKERGRWGLF